MIYVSSSCVKADTIKKSVLALVHEGFRNIELSGGTQYYDKFVKDLLELKEEFDLNFLVHNYFPPPKEDFVLNLASLDQNIYFRSFNHLKTGLELTRLLGGKKFGFHAGFYVDRPVSELGKAFHRSSLYDKKIAMNRFCQGFEFLKNEFNDIDIYIENNCYSISNFNNYGDNAPFMLLNSQDYQDLKLKIDFNLLLDIGHLQVSSKSLDLDFNNELQLLFNKSDYIHISDNDALHDQHFALLEHGFLINKINNLDWNNKIITLEVCEGIEELKETYNIVSSFHQVIETEALC